MYPFCMTKYVYPNLAIYLYLSNKPVIPQKQSFFANEFTAVHRPSPFFVKEAFWLIKLFYSGQYKCN